MHISNAAHFGIRTIELGLAFYRKLNGRWPKLTPLSTSCSIGDALGIKLTLKKVEHALKIKNLPLAKYFL